MSTRVVIADDHPVYRRAVARALGAGMGLDCVGETADGESALMQIRELVPDVALLDVDMPELDGLGVLKALAAEGLGTRVVLLTGHASREPVYQALASGACGYLIKTADGNAIRDAVAAVMRGQTVLSPEVQDALADEIRLRSGPERPLLTEREREVLRLSADGLSAPQVAERVEISANTVRTHLKKSYDKLGVSDKAAAVAEAMRLGLIE